MKILRISGLTRISSADAVPGRRRGQVDDPGVEPVPVGQAFEHVVVDGDVAQGGRHRPALAGRGAEDDVAAGVLMAHRGDIARLASEDVEHAHPVVLGGDLGQRTDADVELELADALLVHLQVSFVAASAGQSLLLAGDLLAPRGLHPGVSGAGVVDDLGHV
jgi:hypothetical protein